jgi:hypothetical protein
MPGIHFVRRVDIELLGHHFRCHALILLSDSSGAGVVSLEAQ